MDVAARKKRAKKTPGPKADRLVIDPNQVGDVLKSLLKPKPQPKKT